MNASILDFVVGRLGQCKGRWPQVAASSGVPYRTVQKIGSGKTGAPRIDTVEKLAAHFRDSTSQFGGAPAVTTACIGERVA